MIIGVNTEVGQDSWIALLCATIVSIPILLVYARIMKIFPGTDIFEISEKLFGKIGGKIIIALFTWYSIHLGALVLRNFSEFIEIVAMPETPQIPIMIAIIFVTIYLAKSNIEIFGKWAIVILPIIMITILTTLIFWFSIMDFSNILPVMGHSVQKVAKSSFDIISFPIAETILFLGLASFMKKESSPYKVYLLGLLIGVAILGIVMLRNVLSLGSAMMEALKFSSFTAARLINIGDFLSRIEGIISVNFILAGITKITVCLISASKGISKLFNLENYKRMTTPVSLLIVALSMILYKSTMEMFNFLTVYPYYAIPFQLIIPIVIWLTAEIKIRKKSKTSDSQIKSS